MSERPMTNPGGFLETTTSTTERPRPHVELPQRGPFLFPPPYNTIGIRLTNADDMGGADRLRDCGYAYWNNINAHQGQPTLFVMVSIKGLGACLYEVNKTTNAVTPHGPLFPPGHPLANETAEGWYWSFTDPDVLYVANDTELYRYHVAGRRLELVVDITPMPVIQERTDEILRQWHSSADDRTHSVTVRAGESRGWQNLGTLVYREGVPADVTWNYFKKTGPLDESHIDKSGNWLVIKENIDQRNGEDNRFIHVPTRTEFQALLDEKGAGGHSDLGYGYMVSCDNWDVFPNSVRLWKLDGSSPQGLVVYHGLNWDAQINHPAHGNARPGDWNSQYAIGSGASRVHLPRVNEILAFPLNGSLQVLVIAPCMTDLDAPGGGGVGPDYDYIKLPKANVCPTGEFVLWTSNCGGERLDAFLVRVPGQFLGGAVPPW